VTFAVPVRNGEAFLRRALDSVLAQDFEDFEIVVSDNASDDATPEILRDYAQRDTRLRLHAHAENVGVLENVNRVFDLARGEFVRLLGVDDWLEPTYLSRCLAAFDACPEAIGVTTSFRTHVDSGEAICETYSGEMPDSPDPVRRLARMLWLVHASDRIYDPVHGLFRRAALARSQRIRIMTFNDRLLAAELALMGPIVHIPECLAHRRRVYYQLDEREALLRRLHPSRWREIDAGPLRVGRVLLSIVGASGLSPSQQVRCLPSVGVFTAKLVRKNLGGRITRFRRRIGLTRRNLGLPHDWGSVS
jgi:glycosyltransferase involved in cell wall biosynthesis